jgi:tetratricopeptide (TPR) repeat protein
MPRAFVAIQDVRRNRYRLLMLLTSLLFLLAPGGSTLGQKQAPIQSQPQSQKEEQILLDAGRKAFEQGHYDEAIRVYQQLLVRTAKTPKTAAVVHLQLGNVYMAQRKFDRACADFQQATALDPNNAEARNSLGESLGELHQYASALEAFNRAVALDGNLLRARYNIGITYGRLGNLKYSEAVFRWLVRDYPDYDLGYDGLAVALTKSGQAKEAIPFHKKAISLSPKEPSFYYNLALSYLVLGDTAGAVEQQKKLQELAPEVASYLANVIVKHQLR